MWLSHNAATSGADGDDGDGAGTGAVRYAHIYSYGHLLLLYFVSVFFFFARRHSIVFIKLKSISVITLLVHNKFDAFSSFPLPMWVYNVSLLLRRMVILQCDGHLWILLVIRMDLQLWSQFSKICTDTHIAHTHTISKSKMFRMRRTHCE